MRKGKKTFQVSLRPCALEKTEICIYIGIDIESFEISAQGISVKIQHYVHLLLKGSMILDFCHYAKTHNHQ